MSISTLINSLEQIDQLLRMESAGNATTLASKLGISRSKWFRMKKELEECFSIKIFYCNYRQTYYYAEPVVLKIGFFRQKTEDRRQKTEDRRQKTETMKRRSDIFFTYKTVKDLLTRS